MSGYKLFVGNEMVHETELPARNVAAIRVNTARGEEFVVLSPLEEDRLQITFDYRDNVNSTFLDLQEAEAREERAAAVEAASPAVQERDASTPSDEEMGIGQDLTPGRMGQIRQAENAEASRTPLVDEEHQPNPVSGTAENFRMQDQVVDSTTPEEAAKFDDARGLTLGEVELGAQTPPGTTVAPFEPPDSTPTSTQADRDLAAKNAEQPMTSWSSGGSTGEPALASPQGGSEVDANNPENNMLGTVTEPATTTTPVSSPAGEPEGQNPPPPNAAPPHPEGHSER